MNRLTLCFFLVLSLAVGGCGEPLGEEEGACGHAEAESLGTAQQALSSISCKQSTTTGYKSGSAFSIAVLTVDGKKVEKSTANAYFVMAQAAAKAGVNLQVVSGFRSMAEQQYLYNCYVTCSCNNCNLAAKPGYSNHQSGHALDLNTSSPGVYAWLSANAGKFGFKRTVPSEAWHWEWWGGGPGGGPCAKLDATLVEASSSAPKDPDGAADYRVCAGQKVPFSFELRNEDGARWVDLGADGKYSGDRVRLSTLTDEADLMTGKKRFSVKLNENPRVFPKSQGGTVCNDAPKCRRTVFEMVGKAPAKPGIYKSRWQLRDYSPAWSEAKAFGPKVNLSFKVVECADSPPPAEWSEADMEEEEELEPYPGDADAASAEDELEAPPELDSLAASYRGDAAETASCALTRAPARGGVGLALAAVALLGLARRRSRRVAGRVGQSPPPPSVERIPSRDIIR